MMTIGQVSEQTGLSIHTLRYYEQIGLVTPVARLENGHRAYSEEDIDRIGFVLCLKAAGMPIIGIKRYLELIQQGDETVVERLTLLEAHKAEVEQKIEALNQHLTFISGKIRQYHEFHRNQLD